LSTGAALSNKTNPSHPISPLYARYLSSAEKRSLRKVPASDTSSEINLLRVLNSFFMQFQQSAPQDLYARMLALRTCVVLNEQLVCLVRWQLLQPADSDFLQVLWEAIKQANKDEGIPDDL
jgi:hypothetical protein